MYTLFLCFFLNKIYQNLTNILPNFPLLRDFFQTPIQDQTRELTLLLHGNKKNNNKNNLTQILREGIVIA